MDVILNNEVKFYNTRKSNTKMNRCLINYRNCNVIWQAEHANTIFAANKAYNPEKS